MQQNDAQELLDCLPHERTLYAYCHDYYAVQLLELAAGRYPTIKALKGSNFGRLLDKPSINPLIKTCGDGRFRPTAFASYWHDPGATYLLTAGLWDSRSGRYNQTSRPGFNLVLRLNFNHQHDRLLHRTIHPVQDGVFNGWGHPYLQRGERPYYRETLAWARLDVDLDKGEVLVEEIQSDWVREVNWLSGLVKHRQSTDTAMRCYGFHTTVDKARAYLGFVEPLLRGWSQAMLAAVIRFVCRELGISQFWYHSWETGNCLKNIDDRWAPPRSLYSRLPRQFCFEQTDRLPDFLNHKRTTRRLRRAKVKPRFYHLEL